MTSRGCTGRDGGSWACSLCSPCGSAACGTPGDPWPRQPSRSASSFSKCMLQMFPLLQTFHWTDGTLVLFNLWGILAFPVFVPLSSYLLSTSLRASVLLASACLFLGSTVRCRTKRKLSPCAGVTPSHASPLCRCLPLWIPSLGGFEALAHLAAVLNGIAGPIAMSAPITVSGL